MEEEWYDGRHTSRGQNAKKRNSHSRSVLKRKFGTILAAKEAVRNKTNGICWICKRALTLEETTIDHVIETSKGGSFELDNLLPAHNKCNTIRSANRQYHSRKNM